MNPNVRRPGGRLPELDLEDHEMPGRPAPESAPASIPFAQRPPPPPANAPPPDKPLMSDSGTIDLAVEPAAPSSAGAGSAPRPVVHARPPPKSLGGAPSPFASPEEEAERQAVLTYAAFGAVPTSVPARGLYAYRVWRRRRELAAELPAKQKGAADAARELERAMVSFAEGIRSVAEREAPYQGLMREIRQMEAVSSNRGPSGVDVQGELRRALARLGAQAADDRAVFGALYESDRLRLGGLQRIAQERAKSLRLHEQAQDAFDPEAYKRGLGVLAALAALAVLLFFSPVIIRAVSPPDLPPLPPTSPAVSPH